jgi:hypothetical protein
MGIPSDDKIFYHALYHHVTHWAAYVAMNGLLITFAFFLSLSPPIDGANLVQRLIIAQFAVLASLCAALYFTSGMYRYGKKLNESVPKYYLDYYLKISHNKMTLLQLVGSFSLAVLDEWILLVLLISAIHSSG